MIKKEKSIVKNSFIHGTFIATMGIVISKVLGIVYAIPFHNIVGEKGGALYGYAYSIYAIFLGISNVGIPIAVSKMISEYHTLNMPKSKEKVFRIANNILNIVGLIAFLVLFIYAPFIAKLIIGDIRGGNTISDIVFVIRVISFSILIVPTLSVYRGYIQGHRDMTPTAKSQILEQIIRVSIIVIGGLVGSKVLHLPVRDVVSIALAGATIGSFFSWLYLYIKIKKNKHIYNNEEVIDEDVATTKTIISTIALYSFPFIVGDIAKSLFNSVDTFFVVKTLVNDLGYKVTIAETVMGVISTWGDKLVKIVIAIGTGFVSALIPHLTVSLVKKDNEDINKKIVQSFQILTLITFPMTVGLSLLARPVWNIFYGSGIIGPKVFMFSVYTAYITVLFTTSITILIALKEYKIFLTAIISGLVFNAVFDRPLMLLFGLININFLPAYYGAILSTILGNLLTIIITMVFLHLKYHVKFKSTFILFLKVIIASFIMGVILVLLNRFIPVQTGRLYNLFVIIINALVGIIIYYLVTNKFNLYNIAFGQTNVDRIKNKIKKVFR